MSLHGTEHEGEDGHGIAFKYPFSISNLTLIHVYLEATLGLLGRDLDMSCPAMLPAPSRPATANAHS